MKYCLLILLFSIMGMTGCETAEVTENPQTASAPTQDKPIHAVEQRIILAKTDTDLNKLLEEFSDDIRQDPTNPVAYFYRGRVHDRKSHYYKTHLESGHSPQDEYEMAVADFTKAIELDPDFAKAHEYRGYAHYYKSEPGKAVADFTVSIRLKPDDGTYVMRGFAYSFQREFNKAIADYNTAIRLNPTSGVAYYNRALANDALGNVDPAKIEADFSRARELGFED